MRFFYAFLIHRSVSHLLATGDRISIKNATLFLKLYSIISLKDPFSL